MAFGNLHILTIAADKHLFMLICHLYIPSMKCLFTSFVHFLIELFFYFFILYLFIWLHWVFVAVSRLPLVAASEGYSSLRCTGFSLRWLLLRSMASRRAGSVVVAHGLSCSAACGIFPDQGLNRCPLHWQADS